MAQIQNIIMMTIVGLCMTQINGQYNQRATLYSGQGSTGAFINIIETYAADLNSQSFDNRAYSVCVTGAWLFYENSNFNPSNAIMEYFFGPNNYCANLQNIGGRLSSARFAGDPKNYSTESLTLFTGTYFQGTEEYAVGDLANLNLDMQASSVLVTGPTAWTVYAQPKFSGDRVCIQPPGGADYPPAFIYDTNSINVPNRTIRSIRKGCYSKKIAFAETLTSGGYFNVTLSPNDANVGVLSKNHPVVNKF